MRQLLSEIHPLCLLIPFFVSKLFILCKENKIKGGVSFMWNNNTVEVNLFDHVDRWVGYDKSCIQRGACNLYYRVKTAVGRVL